MSEIIRSLSNLACMWIFGALGDMLVITGIVNEARDLTLAHIDPLAWFLLGVVCYMGMLWIVALKILVRAGGVGDCTAYKI